MPLSEAVKVTVQSERVGDAHIESHCAVGHRGSTKSMPLYSQMPKGWLNYFLINTTPQTRQERLGIKISSEWKTLDVGEHSIHDPIPHEENGKSFGGYKGT